MTNFCEPIYTINITILARFWYHFLKSSILILSPQIYLFYLFILFILHVCHYKSANKSAYKLASSKVLIGWERWMKSSYPFGSCPNLELWHHHRILKTNIRHYDVICLCIENTYTTLWRHTNLCCLCQMRNIQMENKYFKRKVCKYK